MQNVGWIDLKFWRTMIWQEIKGKLGVEAQNGYMVCPSQKMIFRSLTLTPLNKVKVVILGQDPYHTPGAADGLAFSVPATYKTPPSLVNIFKELQSDLKITDFLNGPLDGWAQQGVLLINSIWSVRAHYPESHSLWGWQNLTREIITTIAIDINPSCVFILWGSHAQSFKPYLFDNGFVIESPHPSPFSSHKGFFGSRPFSKCNDILINQGETPIDWRQINNYADSI